MYRMLNKVKNKKKNLANTQTSGAWRVRFGIY